MAEIKHQSRKKKFIKDFGIYAIGNLGSKLITFLMIPLYTYFVEKPSDYGYFDLCLQVCFLMFPVITLQLRDGAFRFLLDTQDTNERSRIITFAYRTLGITIISTIALAFCLSLFVHIDYLWSTIALLVVMSAYEFLAQISRGLGNNKAFIAVGLIASFGICLFSLIFVAWFKMGILGIFLANILARVLSILIVEYKMKTFSRFFNIKIDLKDISKQMLNYSVPLIPVSLCWLFTTTSDRYFVSYFLGFGMTGIYAIAVRFGGLIHTLSNIFLQTWQENAIQQYNSPDRDDFFSKVFNYYIYVLCFTLIAFTFTLKICYGWIIGANYQDSLEFVYLINLSTILFAITVYFELPYQCAKDTKRAIPSIILTAVVNITLNFILTPLLHIYGVILTAIISYLTLIIYRWIDTRRYFTLHFQPRTLIPLSLILISAIPFYLNDNHLIDALYIVLSILILAIFTPEELKTSIINKFKRTHRYPEN
jgi:O-antigen/teichoic acid export membrane protein